ncbi:HAD-IIIC family phosphatase [Streptomyces spectabilis]|uniref:FkbH-like protein n=1 Tax=Streptomyces spectabilis TaxID=68270 RepID=A0A7W8AMX9_STRST|nr:HAD-IIIC family phosphatase [Streptomyces spectabilis]MBB5101379.1 FkbH-like protein [Streptomyces spectabilis]MCI3900575.1 HAD-IIIC family phosphatase [Streptomyces spectabilis]GGV11017.1 haloacid dehalogenase [Streptomyces spectabilis]
MSAGTGGARDGTAAEPGAGRARAAEPTVKCLVWDLDDTLWDGVALEGDAPEPFPAAVRAVRALDRRGVLHAVASRGEHAVAAAHLAAHGLDTLFTVLEVGWGAKSGAVERIAAELDIGLDTVAFIDNDAVERAEVAAALPDVRCYRAHEAELLTSYAEFTPRFVTQESARRRDLYRTERRRKAAEAEHTGVPAAFLASLDLVLTVRRATGADLARAHELTVRTHQLNTTGRTFGPDELRRLCEDPGHEVLVAGLTDRFGSYGTIGLAVTSLRDDATVLELLLMSCRVMSRGVGAVLIDHIVARSLAAGRRPVAEFVPTGVNRQMLVTLRFAGFEVVEDAGDRITLAVDPDAPPPARKHPVRVVTP